MRMIRSARDKGSARAFASAGRMSTTIWTMAASLYSRHAAALARMASASARPVARMPSA